MILIEDIFTYLVVGDSRRNEGPTPDGWWLTMPFFQAFISCAVVARCFKEVGEKVPDNLFLVCLGWAFLCLIAAAILNVGAYQVFKYPKGETPVKWIKNSVFGGVLIWGILLGMLHLGYWDVVAVWPNF